MGARRRNDGRTCRRAGGQAQHETEVVGVALLLPFAPALPKHPGGALRDALGQEAVVAGLKHREQERALQGARVPGRHGRRQRQGPGLLPLFGLPTQKRWNEHGLRTRGASAFSAMRLRRRVATRWQSVAHVHRVEVGKTWGSRNGHRFHARHDARVEASAQCQLVTEGLRGWRRSALQTGASISGRHRSRTERRTPRISHRRGGQLRVGIITRGQVALCWTRSAALWARARNHSTGRHVPKPVEDRTRRHRIADGTSAGRSSGALGLRIGAHERSLARSPPLIPTFTPNVLFPLRCQVRLRSQAQ